MTTEHMPPHECDEDGDDNNKEYVGRYVMGGGDWRIIELDG